MFAQLASRYGWTPDEMSRMTVAQLWYYAKAGTGSESGHVGMNRAQAIASTRWKHQQRAAELAALQEALFDES